MTEKPSLPKNRSPRRTPIKRRQEKRAGGLRTKEREKRDLEPKGKSYSTLRLRESLTSTPVPRGENQQAASTATCYLYKYSVVPTAQGDSLLILHVIHDLINEYNSGCRHSLLGRTTLKKID